MPLQHSMPRVVLAAGYATTAAHDSSQPTMHMASEPKQNALSTEHETNQAGSKVATHKQDCARSVRAAQMRHRRASASSQWTASNGRHDMSSRQAGSLQAPYHAALVRVVCCVCHCLVPAAYPSCGCGPWGPSTCSLMSHGPLPKKQHMPYCTPASTAHRQQQRSTPRQSSGGAQAQLPWRPYVVSW